jgi:hypothetical protein
MAYSGPFTLPDSTVATPNYGYEKRQKELAKKKKKEEKLREKANRKAGVNTDGQPDTGAPGEIGEGEPVVPPQE